MLRIRDVLLAGILFAVLVTEMLPAFSEGPAVIAVVLSRDIAPYRDALEGFEGHLTASRKPFKLIDFNIEAWSHDPAALIDKIRSRRPVLILTLGSAATDFVSDRVQDVPVIFSLVLPSTGSGSLEHLRGTHRNIAGATMEIPIALQFEKIRSLIPEARKVGVLYDPQVSGPVIDAARAVASGAGMTLVPLSVSSEGDVVRETEDLAERVDVLWSVADSTVFTPQGLKHILLATLRNRIPFVGLSPAFVKAGALLALSCDYEDIGRQSAEIAVRVLDGERPDRIPTAVPRVVNLSLNMNTARQINVAITEEVRHAAATVF
jgi:putative ABC transport system substrate-binding protein